MTKEVFRTAFEYIENHQNGLGKGLPDWPTVNPWEMLKKSQTSLN
jgi:hypothetical protein